MIKWEIKKILKEKINLITLGLLLVLFLQMSFIKPMLETENEYYGRYYSNYNVHYKEIGAYSKVFSKLNFLSNKLNDNEIEREKIEKMREDWIANISRDIKTPISSIKGYAEILEYDCDFSKK
ncbi:MAG: hypothetical protein RSG52_05485 [Terrisporobacter sp.]|uniref:histidine kinase dimerization/phospho-acceptor domain-containing protein n=1 Tax=Terrisporobacter sp. TaxID=1965305 RepID=UPI002FCBE805